MNQPRSQPTTPSARGRLSFATLCALALLLALPAYALSQLTSSLDWRVLAGVALILSIFAFFAYRSDKRRAETGAQRVPEATLQLVALLGGWPGAFLAQRLYRHKTSKLLFQFLFWIVVLLHQFVALDFILGGRLSKAAIAAIKS